MSRLLSKYPLTLTLWQRIAVVVEPNGSVVEGVGVQDLGAKSADIVGIEFVRVSDLRPNPANPAARKRLTVPVIPFAEIERCGARMYLGKKRAGVVVSSIPGFRSGGGGSIPTPALQFGQREAVCA